MNRRVLNIAAAVVLLTVVGCASSQSNRPGVGRSDRGHAQAADVLRGEVGCALCIYHMPGVKECVLAAKVGERVMLVEGVDIDDLGDAHDPQTGLCNVSRKAAIEGRIEGDKLVATRITPQP